MSEFHVQGEEVYYRGFLVARLVTAPATVMEAVIIDLEALSAKEHEDELEDARKAAYDKGEAAGKEQGNVECEADLRSEMADLRSEIAALEDDLAVAEKELSKYRQLKARAALIRTQSLAKDHQ